MALASSGTISIGGTTAGRSINLELGRSATATSSLGEATLRALANDTSGAISMSTFRGKSSNETQTVTVGSYYDGAAYVPTTSYGYTSDTNSYGSISDGTLGVAGNKTIQHLAWNNLNILTLRVAGVASNSGWTTMTVNGTAFSRASASFYQNGTASTAWQWLEITTNPFGTSGTKQAVFT